MPLKKKRRISISCGKGPNGEKLSAQHKWIIRRSSSLLHRLGTAKVMAAAYKRNQKSIMALIPEKHRIELLRLIAGRKGIVFPLKYKPTEEELLNKIYGTPLKEKHIQQSLF